MNIAEGTIEDIIKQYPKWIQKQNTLENDLPF